MLKNGRKYEQSAPSIAFSFVSRAFVISKNSGYILGEARASAQLASINVVYNSLVQATAYAKQALALYKTLGNGYKLELAGAYLNLGIYQGKEKLYASALKDIHAGLSIYQGMKYQNGIFLCYKNLGFIYQLAGRPHLALTYYLKAKTLNKKASVDTSYLSLLEHLGNTYILLDSDERALQVFKEGIDKSGEESSHAKHHLSLLRATGRLHEKLGNEDKAIGYHKLALSKSIASGKPEEQARSLMALADLFRNKNSEQSIIHLNKALGIARQLGNKALAAEIYQTLTEIYRQQNRFEEALMALKAHHGLLDTLIQINKISQNEIARSNLSIQTFKIENERLLLENKKRTLERNAGGVMLIVIFLVLIFIGYHFYLMRKLNRKLYISNRIKDKLFSIIGHDLRNPIGGISTMLSILEKRIWTLKYYIVFQG
ncbi:tetratricopeptide repeat protein [Pedobacter sp. P26]|uniref:tetratricopeptide repeat protein n=1 Tax=Pedobacter sp. P26 TaxID=3423956 RepID=UPI003D66F2C1